MINFYKIPGSVLYYLKVDSDTVNITQLYDRGDGSLKSITKYTTQLRYDTIMSNSGSFLEITEGEYTTAYNDIINFFI
jgi:hypothetical protein